jgi:hypothetical protein
MCGFTNKKRESGTKAKTIIAGNSDTAALDEDTIPSKRDHMQHIGGKWLNLAPT